MCKENYDCCQCAQGPQGVPGLQGEQGIQGVPGAQGIAGQTGMQGVQGLQGLAGKDCEAGQDCHCCESWCNVYALPPQLLSAFGGATDTVLFHSQNAVTAPNFDLSQMGVNGDLKFLKSGVYYINYGAEAKVQPPLPSPTPSFSFGLWLNGVLIPGSVLSGYTQAPGDDTLHISGEVTIAVMAGDILRLRNASSLAIDMTPNTVGIQFPVTVASLNIHCLSEILA